MSLTLYAPKAGERAWKALIAANYTGVTINVPPFEMGVDNKTPEFLKKNPLGKIPVLETPEGCIFESNAIARYVARLNESSLLLGKNAFETALVNQWIDFAIGEIELPARAWIYPILGLIENNPDVTSKAKADVRKALGVLNTHLLSKTFLVGERITLADIIVTCTLYRLYTMVLDTGFRKAFANTNRWFTTCVNQPEFQSVMGEVSLCVKAVSAPGPKKEEQPKEEKKKEQKQEKPKEEKKKESKPKKKNDDDDDEDDDAPRQEKRANPLDALPKTSFILDDWKRAYSNSSNYAETFQAFWANLDREGYCIYFCDYKYNEELTKPLFACNLVGGFLQRLDPLRKYGFGCIVILGEENNMNITGCFLFRGQGIPAEMSDCADFDTYDFKPADLNDEATRKKVELLWTWEGDFGARPLNTGKVFK